MELRDLIVTPIVIFVVCLIAYKVRPFLTDENTRKYFFPALFLKIIGALLLGVLYQFYYQGGDTINFHTYGSRIVWEALTDSPITGLKLIFSKGELTGDTFKYASRIVFYSDPSSFFVVRIASVFDIITFSSYAATAVLFSVLSFAGMWALFITFYNLYQHLHTPIAFATLFIPSVVFWGSGIMKDTVTLSALGFLTYSVYQLFIRKQYSLSGILLLFFSVWTIFSIKKYILLCFLPAVLLWIYASRIKRIKSAVLRFLIIPFMLFVLILSSYYSVVLVGENDSRYAVDRIAKTAQITAYDIGFYTGKDAGSGYNLGELDGTFEGMIKLLPAAINVSLFRPYLWEIRNPLMFLSALESAALFLITLYLLFRFRFKILNGVFNPSILFCLAFSLTFAFAVGVSTFNFGTLTRYKIPLLPFYVMSIFLLLDYSNKERKLDVLEKTE